MTNQERNREALIDHIAEQDRIIRRRNEQIAAQVEIIEEVRRDLAEYQGTHTRQIETIARLQKTAKKAEKERDNKAAAYDQMKALFGAAERAALRWKAHAAESRPLTADDGMLSRAVLEARKHRGTCDAFHSEVQAIVNAALTEPPATLESIVDEALTKYTGGYLNGGEVGTYVASKYADLTGKDN